MIDAPVRESNLLGMVRLLAASWLGTFVPDVTESEMHVSCEHFAGGKRLQSDPFPTARLLAIPLNPRWRRDRLVRFIC